MVTSVQSMWHHTNITKSNYTKLGSKSSHSSDYSEPSQMSRSCPMRTQYYVIGTAAVGILNCGRTEHACGTNVIKTAFTKELQCGIKHKVNIFPHVQISMIIIMNNNEHEITETPNLLTRQACCYDNWSANIYYTIT